MGAHPPQAELKNHVLTQHDLLYKGSNPSALFRTNLFPRQTSPGRRTLVLCAVQDVEDRREKIQPVSSNKSESSGRDRSVNKYRTANKASPRNRQAVHGAFRKVISTLIRKKRFPEERAFRPGFEGKSEFRTQNWKDHSREGGEGLRSSICTNSSTHV